uniref:Uncharacterized protein n=1 Tax=Plectus sambesii TaxID=2011161 RepID=A0A914VRC0_9BILA
MAIEGNKIVLAFLFLLIVQQTLTAPISIDVNPNAASKFRRVRRQTFVCLTICNSWPDSTGTNGYYQASSGNHIVAPFPVQPSAFQSVG